MKLLRSWGFCFSFTTKSYNLLPLLHQELMQGVWMSIEMFKNHVPSEQIYQLLYSLLTSHRFSLHLKHQSADLTMSAKGANIFSHLSSHKLPETGRKRERGHQQGDEGRVHQPPNRKRRTVGSLMGVPIMLFTQMMHRSMNTFWWGCAKLTHLLFSRTAISLWHIVWLGDCSTQEKRSRIRGLWSEIWKVHRQYQQCGI